MNIKINLQKFAEFGIGLTAVAILALAGCGGGGGGSTAASVVVSTFAGTSGKYGFTDGTGTAARFFTPAYIASDGTNLYVTDTFANNIRKIVIATGAVSTFAGSTTGVSGVTDAPALFNQPHGITINATNLYVADSGNNNIRQIALSTGSVTTIAGSITGISGTANATGTAARFNFPWGISRIGTNLYVADAVNSTIRKIDISSASSVVTTPVGTPGSFGHTDSPTGASAVLGYPAGLTTDGISLFLTELFNNDVRKINPSTGETTTVAGGNYLSPASGVGSTDGTGTSARFYNPYGITTDGTNLYVSDTFNHTIRKIFIASGAVTTLAGTAGVSGVTDATGSAARFNYPSDVIYIIGGALYVADYINGTIRKIQL